MKTLTDKRREIFDLLIKIIPTKAGRIYRILREQDEKFRDNLCSYLSSKLEGECLLKKKDIKEIYARINEMFGERLR